MNRRQFSLLGAIAFGVAAGGMAMAQSQAPQFFRIGTGGTAGTYYPIGGLIANAISNPPGSRPCEEGGSCGVPGLIATALSRQRLGRQRQRHRRRHARSRASRSPTSPPGPMTGTGIWEDRDAVEKLRAIANLYPETIHLVASRRQRHRQRRRPRGQDASRSTSRARARWSTRASSSAPTASARTTSRPQYLKPDQAAERMRDGAMDAFFFVGGFPAGAIAELASQDDITLVPISGDEAKGITRRIHLLRRERRARRHL